MPIITNAVRYPLNLSVLSETLRTREPSERDTHILVINMVEPWVSPMDESFRSGDLSNEEEEEEVEGVHDDRPAMGTTGLAKNRKAVNVVGSGELAKKRGYPWPFPSFL